MDWMTVAERFGVPLAILMLILLVAVPTVWFAGRRVAHWIAKEIVIPVRNRHFAFLDKLDGTLDRLTENQMQLAQTQAKQAEDIQSIRDSIKGIQGLKQ